MDSSNFICLIVGFDGVYYVVPGLWIIRVRDHPRETVGSAIGPQYVFT